MKKNLAKKIVSISLIVLVLALVVTTIVLALVPKKMTNPLTIENCTITIYQGTSTEAQISYNPNATKESELERNKIFETIKELHCESLEASVLSAMFQGTGKFKVSVEKLNTPNVISSVAKKEGNALEFTYLDGARELKLDGVVYDDDDFLSSTKVTYDMIVMTLGTSENFEECTLYLADSSTKVSSYQVKFLAHQSELNNYITSLDLGI